MTDQTSWTVWTDDDGNTMILEDYDGDYALRLNTADDVLSVPPHIADAIRLAADLGPQAVLRDVRPLLDQVARKETNARPEQRYLYAHQIRRALGQPKCGQVSTALGGARCGRDEHTGDDSWHVDETRALRWRHVGNDFEVRGWSPDEMGVGPASDLTPMTEDEEVARTVDVLDRHGAPYHLDALASRDFLKEHGLLGPIPSGIMRRVVTTRQTRLGGDR